MRPKTLRIAELRKMQHMVANKLLYYHREDCRLCRSKNLIKVLDLGEQPLAGGFLDQNEFQDEKFFPLRLYFCKDCTLIQNSEIIDKEVLFKHYFYISSASKTGVDHFKSYAEDLNTCFARKKGDNLFIVELGSNDGVLLLPLREFGHNVLGVEPSKNITEIARKKGLAIINDFFTQEVAREIVDKHSKADIITANNVLAHIDDMEEVIKGILILLKPEGILVFEVHYLLDLIEKLQYDAIYHEHFCYHSVIALSKFFEKWDMNIYKVQRVPMHEGSIRVYVKRKENLGRLQEKSVQELIRIERDKQLDNEQTFYGFTQRINKQKEMLNSAIQQIKQKGERIVGYGAAGRANTLLNYCNITYEMIDYIVDASPLRQGKYTPGTHIPIFSIEKFREDNPENVLLLAWSYKKEILEKEYDYRKKGGKFVIPLPMVEII